MFFSMIKISGRGVHVRFNYFLFKKLCSLHEFNDVEAKEKKQLCFLFLFVTLWKCLKSTRIRINSEFPLMTLHPDVLNERTNEASERALDSITKANDHAAVFSFKRMNKFE